MAQAKNTYITVHTQACWPQKAVNVCQSEKEKNYPLESCSAPLWQLGRKPAVWTAFASLNLPHHKQPQEESWHYLPLLLLIYLLPPQAYYNIYNNTSSIAFMSPHSFTVAKPLEAEDEDRVQLTGGPHHCHLWVQPWNIYHCPYLSSKAHTVCSYSRYNLRFLTPKGSRVKVSQNETWVCTITIKPSPEW